MSLQQLVGAGLIALLVFWSVGAHERLRLLRLAVAAAWLKVDEALQQRAAAAAPLLGALREPLAAEQGALDALQSQLAESVRTAAQMTARPLQQDRASAWVAGEAGVAAAASRVFALLEHEPALRDLEPLVEAARQWRESESRLAFARQLFNEAGAVYNDAIGLFPTRLLAPLFRFRRVGKL